MQLEVHNEPTNVYIFVADALRWDAMPDDLASDGDLVKTVSSSPLSCTAFTTMLTGVYPPQHGVWHFSNSIDENLGTIFDLTPNRCPTYMLNTITQGIDDIERYAERERFRNAIKDATEPFVVVDRELSTHAPYGYDMSHPEIPENKKEFTSLSEYWDERKNALSRLQEDYETGVRKAKDRFRDRVDILRRGGGSGGYVGHLHSRSRRSTR